MIDKNTLQGLYDSGRLESAQVLQQQRDAIRVHTELHVPRRVGDVVDWWESNKSVFARRMNEGEESSETTDEDSNANSDSE